MKKLMIAAVAAMCGMAASAAQVQWSVDESYVGGSDFEVLDEGYYAYFLVDTGTLTSGSAYSIANAAADLDKGDASFVGTYAIANQSGDIANAISGGAVTSWSADVFGNDQDIVGYLVLMDNIDPSKATKAFLADATEMGDPATTHINTIGGSDPILFGYLENTVGEWTTVGAPEPTSGLLLLLGVAGLALRRRRA